MLGKHVIGYLPSLVVPAIASFVAIFCYTRLLEPHQYGYYTLTISTMTLLNAVFFYWLQISLPRLMPQAIMEGKDVQLRMTSYAAFAVVCDIMLVSILIFTYMAPLGELYHVIWLAVPLALARSFLNLNQAFHRSYLNIRRYNLIECGQALLGLIIGLVLVYFFNLENLGAILGIVIGMTCMMLVDIRSLLSFSLKQFSPPILSEIAHFGLPLVFTYGLAFIISTSDRFIIEHYYGADDVGIYAAGYGLMERITTMIFMIVAMPSFPLTVHKLEHEGIEAAKAQTYDNGILMLALTLPACAGLIMVSPYLAAILMGEEFREGAIRIMPWIALSAILSGLSTHYFDHAFHLGKKPYKMLFTQGPAAAFNLVANFILIPEYGYMGAVYSVVCTYVLLLILSIVVGRRVFPMQFPFEPAMRIGIAVGLMMAVLSLISLPKTLLGLAGMISIGGTVYVVSLVILNVMDLRTELATRCTPKMFISG